MIDLFLTIIFYMALATTGWLLVVFFIALMQAYDLTQAEKVATKPVKVDIPDYGLSRFELNRIVGQVLKNDRDRVKRGYRFY